ncbi:MAG: hypothetical protein IIT65_06250 [Lachnospiraceae bacterium]|nr:hypothetical protein [Lachnospiraceae bacterium]
MNSQLNIDLQAFVKRVYDSLLYNSTFFNFLNENYIGEVRQTGAPIIEVIKTTPMSVNVRQTAEIQSALAPALSTYSSVKVDLTELPMDYSIRVPVTVVGSDITNALQDVIDLKDSAIAKQIDTYGYAKLKGSVTQAFQWNPANQQGYIDALNTLRATLFNKDVYGGYRLGLDALEYANYVSALTSILKFETMAGVEGVDRGIIARAYGVDAFEINSNYVNPVVADHSETVKGYFFNSVAVVGDTFFDSFVQYNGNYPGFPGYYVIEGNMMFGADVVRGDAIIKLQSESVSS